MSRLRFARLSRTTHSEQYELVLDEKHVAHLDLHYAATNVFATLVLADDLADNEIPGLIQQIDDELVESAETPREDFFVRVFRGRLLEEFSDVLRQVPDGGVDSTAEFDLN